jgi:hypothetical protein
LGWSVRQVKRLLHAVKKRGDQAVIHGLRGKPSNQRIEESIEKGRGEDPVGGRASGMRADSGGRVFTREARDGGEPTRRCVHG